MVKVLILGVYSPRGSLSHIIEGATDFYNIPWPHTNGLPFQHSWKVEGLILAEYRKSGVSDYMIERVTDLYNTSWPHSYGIPLDRWKTPRPKINIVKSRNIVISILQLRLYPTIS